MPQNALWPGCDSILRVGSCLPARPLSDPTCRLVWPLKHVGVQPMVGRGPHRNFEARIHAKAANFVDKEGKLLSAEIARRGDNSEIGNERFTSIGDEIAGATHLLEPGELRDGPISLHRSHGWPDAIQFMRSTPRPQSYVVMKQMTSVNAKKSVFDPVPRLSSFSEPPCSMGRPVNVNLVMQCRSLPAVWIRLLAGLQTESLLSRLTFQQSLENMFYVHDGASHNMNTVTDTPLLVVNETVDSIRG